MKSFMAISGFAAALVFYAFTTFATKDEIRESVLQRLDRIEIKIDRILDK